VYLEKPNKEIQFELGSNQNLNFAAGGMQGWRINMVSRSGHSTYFERTCFKKESYNLRTGRYLRVIHNFLLKL